MGYRKGKTPRKGTIFSIFSCLMLLLLGFGVQERRLNTVSVSPNIFGWMPTADPDADADGTSGATERWPVDTTGVDLYDSRGDVSTCRDVIYTVDSRAPDDGGSIVNASWGALSFVVEKFPVFNSTCSAFFRVSGGAFGDNGTLHPVWGRVPATVLAMRTFRRARVFLYLDTDAMLASPRIGPSDMYRALVAKHGVERGENDTARPTSVEPPSLVVNKPTKRWLCQKQCEVFGLGHGCFNSGALLWYRSEGAILILRSWWESRLDDPSMNFVRDGKVFYGWPSTYPARDKMSEQNRLMYVYGTNVEAARRILPVPRQPGSISGTTSCPEEVDDAHVPCLQDDHKSHNPEWDRKRRFSCFVNHYSITKNTMHELCEQVIESSDKESIRERLSPLIRRTLPDNLDLADSMIEGLMTRRNAELLGLLDDPNELDKTIREWMDIMEKFQSMTTVNN